MFKATVITLYPEMFPGPLGASLAGSALQRNDWQLETVHLRDFGEGKHKRVDDTPAGGGAGMVLRADILANAIDSIAEDNRPRLLMSPRGAPLTQKEVRALAEGDGAVIICGRFEGVDQRVIDARNLQEVSIGDYILSGGEPAAIVMLDAIVRLLPGVMGNETSGTSESFENDLLEHPHYTRPNVWENLAIPDVLTSGNHKNIAEWQNQKSNEITQKRRPDLNRKSPGSAAAIMPALPVTDLEEGVKFYTEALGFECLYLDEGGYAVLTFDAVELHLWLANDESWKNETRANPVRSGAETFIAGTHSCRIEVSGIKTLYKRLLDQNRINLDQEPEKKEWGSTEFIVKDPYGNLIIFHEWI
ncbi:MAG: tRNA (guanosine(37)-N1)-methyltransferase TrmD [Pseudomonadota bacterium]